MSSCSLCHKKLEIENCKLFNIPEDERRRNKWSEICGIQLSANAPICVDHFLPKDIIDGSLSPDAEPYTFFRSKNFATTNIRCKTSYNKTNQKCRCCTKPSANLTQLSSYIKTSEGMEKTYKELLYEITNFQVSLS